METNPISLALNLMLSCQHNPVIYHLEQKNYSRAEEILKVLKIKHSMDTQLQILDVLKNFLKTNDKFEIFNLVCDKRLKQMCLSKNPCQTVKSVCKNLRSLEQLETIQMMIPVEILAFCVLNILLIASRMRIKRNFKFSRVGKKYLKSCKHFNSSLRMSLENNFIYLPFNRKVKIEEVDEIIDKHGIKFLQYILQYHTNNQKKIKIQNGVILNTIPSFLNEIQNPNECLRCILERLILRIKILYPKTSRITHSQLRSISRDSEIRAILKDTGMIRKIDFSQLTTDSQTLTFFLNLWNIMFLHALLTIWRSSFPLNSLQLYSSMSGIYYLIGSRDRISLATLREILLKDVGWNNGIFEIPHKRQIYDFDRDPRTIFAMINEFYETPVLRIFHEDTLDSDLEEAVCDYLNCYYDKNSQNCPKLLQIYENFAKKSQLENPNYRAMHLASNMLLFNSTASKKQFPYSDITIPVPYKQHPLLLYIVQKILGNDSNLFLPWIFALTQAIFHDDFMKNFAMVDLYTRIEKFLLKGQIIEFLELVNALPPNLSNSLEIQCIRDKIFCHLVTVTRDAKYVQDIRSPWTLFELGLSHYDKWPAVLTRSIFSRLANSQAGKKLPMHCRMKIEEISSRIELYFKILPYLKKNVFDLEGITWLDIAYCSEKTDPASIIRILVRSDESKLCLEWLMKQNLELENLSPVLQDLLIGLLRNGENDFELAKTLLSLVPVKQSLKMCKVVLKHLDASTSMKFIINRILEFCEPNSVKIYKKAQLGVEMLSLLEPKDRCFYVDLIKEPLLMLEQLLMNGKFEKLKEVLGSIPRTEISMKDFNEIVRFYALKSIDFRVSIPRDDSESREIVKSLDSKFVMPILVPSKAEWVPDHEGQECSCCKRVKFSMFNRRHHCRRCGRLVCGACSRNRMQVAGYPATVLVRVCKDCKKQTELQMTSAQSIKSVSNSMISENWKLSTKELHNKTVREEFSFDSAPDVPLCLVILDLHSDHQSYANFLLDRCHYMRKLLSPGPGGKINNEINHVLIIKMIRTLLVAVKVKCAKLGLNTGLAHCDTFLSQMDLISTLVQSNCLVLIPSDETLDDQTLRKLRDSLIEKEYWTLALDVSTKWRLETQVVWAAWGMAYLKASHYQKARIKFSHCMEKISEENSNDWVFIPDSPKKLPKVYQIKPRPVSSPPLLLEILQILETQKLLYSRPSKISDDEISESENSLELNDFKIMNEIFNECLHYLLSYGSFSLILEFFVRHEQLDVCLAYVLENSVDPEFFYNSVYVVCLKNGIVDKLLSALQNDEPGLTKWKKYLVYVCHTLNKKRALDELYYLQQFIKDHVRAAMTCIRFYTKETTDFVELTQKSKFLMDAQKHLESELTVDYLGKKPSSNPDSLILEMEASEIDKHINTISRQLEVAKFLANAEREGRFVKPYLTQLGMMDLENVGPTNELPTLFGNNQQKTRLAVLAILCGRNPEEGFGLAFRIMQDYNLKPQKIFSLAGHLLVKENQISSIEQLVKCCRSSGDPDSINVADGILMHCIRYLLHNSQDCKEEVESLIKLIEDIGLKVDSYIESRQLKTAYLLAVKYRKTKEVKKILKEADRVGQNAIKSICVKWLKQSEHEKR